MSKLVEKIKATEEVQAPEWTAFVKTGAHKQRPPVNPDWWFVRAASVLKKIEKYGPIGTNNLSKQYGGRKDRGHRPEKKYNGSRNIIRKCLQQLQAAGLVQDNKSGRAGKVLTAKGKALLNEVRGQ